MVVKYNIDEHVIEEDRVEFARLCDSELRKVLRFIEGVQEVVLTLKTNQRDGGRQKFSFHLRIFTGGKPLTAEYSDWKLTDCVHKVFASMHSQVA